MLGRLGFTGRLMAITMLALLALWALGAGLSYVTQAPRWLPHRTLAIPGQMVAIVELLEASSPAQQATILTAVNSDVLTVSISAQRPAVQSSVQRLPAVEWYAKRYADVLGGREVIATVDRADVSHWRDLPWRDYWRYAIRPLQVSVLLRNGSYATFETRGEISRRLLGLPPGFWLGTLGSLIGIAALIAIWREAGPLKELSQAMAGFSQDGQPMPVAARGAPEIRKLITAVNGMQERIAALLKGRTVLLGAVSHDLKTYITRLRLRCETIPEEEQRGRAERDLTEMTSLLDGALAVARGGSAPRHDKTVDLAALLRGVADTPGIELADPAARPLNVNGDVVALRRLVDNLTANALRFAGRCQLSLRRDGNCVQMLVDDDGDGIPESERQLVFEPFYRLETSRSRSTGGSGLGLAIAKQITEAHGGSIAIEASPLGGARFRVTLPIETA
jgi:two-component system, OmpR family, osmolarity sensor histidine kinase EnvZ